MTCTTTSLTHLEARVGVLRRRYLATLAEADGEALLGDPVRHDKLRALGRKQYDVFWREFEAFQRAELDAKYPVTEG